MKKVIELVKKNWAYLVGGVAGGIGGYLYWYYVGCGGAGCSTTSSPTMKIIWGAIFGGLLLSMIFPKNKTSKTKIMALLNEGALVVDVRTRGEYAGGHLKNSKNIPLDELGKALSTLDKAQKIVVVCASGMRSSQAVSLMKKEGFTECYNGGSWTSLK